MTILTRFSTAGLALFCSWTMAATGDVLQIDINTNGWAYVYVEGFPTNATFNNNFINRTNYAYTNEIWCQFPSSTNGLRIDLFSGGYSNGVRVFKPRTLYGTKIVRKPYPNNLQSDIFTNGVTARFHVAVNDFIYATDSNIVATIDAYGFMDGATPCVATNLTAANGSILPDWEPCVQRTRAGFTIWTGNTIPVSLVAFAHDGIDSVEFVGRGATSGTAVTNLVTRIVRALNRNTKGIPWAEYQTELSMAGFTAGELVSVDYTVHPRIGTNFSTFWNKYNVFSERPARYTNTWDPSNSLASYIAVVDVATGSDVNGRATNVAPEQVNSAHYFATIPTALHRMGSSNSWNGGQVYVKSGTTNIGGSTPTFTFWKAHPFLRPYPGDTLTIVTNNSSPNTLHFGGMLAIRDATIAGSGATAGSFVNNARRIWLTNCTINTTHGAPFRATSANSNCVVFVEDCIIQQQTGNFRPFGSEPVHYVSMGNEFNGFQNEFQPVVSVGTRTTNTTSTNFTYATESAATGAREHSIYYNNRFHGVFGSSTVSIGAFGNNAPLTNCAWIQNEWESIKLDGTVFKQFAMSTATYPCDRVLWHNNSLISTRGLSYYQTSITGYQWKRPSVRNNVIYATGWASDDDASSPDGTAIGNWLWLWGTGHRGNAIGNTHGSEHGAAEYAHFSNYYRSGAPNRKPYIWWRFRNEKSVHHDGTSSDPAEGNGDYRWASDSPVFYVPTVALLDYDINLMPRSRAAGLDNWDPPGTSAAGQKKKGFF